MRMSPPLLLRLKILEQTVTAEWSESFLSINSVLWIQLIILTGEHHKPEGSAFYINVQM